MINGQLLDELRDLLHRHNLQLDVTSKVGVIVLARPDGEVQFAATSQEAIVEWLKAGEPAEEPIESLAQTMALEDLDDVTDFPGLGHPELPHVRTPIGGGKQFGDLSHREFKTWQAVEFRCRDILETRLRLWERTMVDLKY